MRAGSLLISCKERLSRCLLNKHYQYTLTSTAVATFCFVLVVCYVVAALLPTNRFSVPTSVAPTTPPILKSPQLTYVNKTKSCGRFQRSNLLANSLKLFHRVTIRPRTPFLHSDTMILRHPRPKTPISTFSFPPQAATSTTVAFFSP